MPRLPIHALLLSLCATFGAGCSTVGVLTEKWFPTELRLDGALAVPGLRAEIRIRRDPVGMAYVDAPDIESLHFGQGFAMAQDRIFQLELARRAANGRLSELVGEATLTSDVLSRTLDFRGLARKQWEKLHPQSRRLYEHFAAGINAYVETLPEERPLELELAGLQALEPWTPVDSLAVIFHMSFRLSADLHQELLLERLEARVGPIRIDELAPLGRKSRYGQAPLDPELLEDPGLHALADFARELAAGGSNNWAVAAHRSSSGKPIVANDPHLDATMVPGPLYPIGLSTPTLRAVGVTLPGAPGIIIGRNDHFAFGLTVNYADVEDLYVERLEAPLAPGVAGRYRVGAHFKALEHRVEEIRVRDEALEAGYRIEMLDCRSSVRGPLVSGLFPTPAALSAPQRALSLRWAGAEFMGDRVGWELLWQAQDVPTFLAAARQIDRPVMNLVWGHDGGDYGHLTVGRVPLRFGHDGTRPVAQPVGTTDWNGHIPFAEMPSELRPERGWTGTANHRVIGDDYPYAYSTAFAPIYRYERMQQIFRDPTPKDARWHRSAQEDIKSLLAEDMAARFVPALRVDRKLRYLAELLEDWDGGLSRHSVAASVYHAIRWHLARETFIDDLGEPLTTDYLRRSALWLERFEALLADNEAFWWDDQRTEGRETLDALIRRAGRLAEQTLRERLGRDPSDWEWGELHALHLRSPLAKDGMAGDIFGAGDFPMGGDGETLMRARHDFAKPFDVKLLASLRMAADLGDACRVEAGMPAGVSGRFSSPHYRDQSAPFMYGQPMPWWLCEPEVAAHTQHTLRLTPLSP